MKPPRRLILGKRSRCRLTDTDVFCDFLEAFCHVALERCSSDIENWETARFGEEYEFRRCLDEEFRRHVTESVQLAKQYLVSRRLCAFEMVMVSPAEVQLIGFQVLMSQLEFAPESERVKNIYRTLSDVLKNVAELEIRESTDSLLKSTVYRPRIRFLTHFRADSQKIVDTSKAVEDHISIPLADSIAYANHLMTFCAHL